MQNRRSAVNNCKGTVYDYSVKSLQQPRFNSVTYGRDSFSYQGAKEWNILDNFIKDAASLNDFKMLIKAWKGKQCNCSYCHVCILERM